jgi:hypothetical protein
MEWHHSLYFTSMKSLQLKMLAGDGLLLEGAAPSFSVV